MSTDWLANAHPESFWPHFSWPGFAALSKAARARAVVVLPVHGFADHGPGLPLDAEEIAGSAVLRRAAEAACAGEAGEAGGAGGAGGVLLRVLPPVRFALAPHPCARFGVDAETAHELLREIAKSVRDSGFSKIVFFNTSPWNEELVATVALDTRVEFGLENHVVNASRLGMRFCADAAGEEENERAAELLARVLLGARAPRPPFPECGREARAPRGSPKGWHSRDYLPHFDQPGVVQSITFRLHDSVPAKVIEQWRIELDCNRETMVPSDDPRAVELRRRIAEYEDAGHGDCHLRNPEIAALVEGALLRFDGERYDLIEWCVMPNHVHVLIATREGHTVPDVVHSWKSFTAKKANAILRVRGNFWMPDYYDRYVRDEAHLRKVREYIRDNPVKAGLAKTAQAWEFGSAWERGHPARFFPGSAGVPPACRSGRDARAPRVSERAGRPRSQGYLPALTAAEIGAISGKEQALVIIPTGAIEQHGPHLPVGVDAILGEALLASALAKLPAHTARRVFVAPPVTFGKSNEHDGFPGTVTVSAGTLRRVLLAIAGELHAMGFRTIAVLNTHGGNSAVIACVLREIQAALGMRAEKLPNAFKLCAGDLTAREALLGIHAGQWETALMLACAPELVRMDKAVCEYPPRPLEGLAWMTRDISKSGVMGDAKAATPELGKAWMENAGAALAVRIGELVEEGGSGGLFPGTRASCPQKSCA